MSEQLSARNQIKNGIKIRDFEWYDDIGATTIKQLKSLRIIPDKDYGEYEKRKVDQILVDRRNVKKIRVIAVVEYKKIGEFTSEKDIKSAIEQCNDMAQELGAIFGVAKDDNCSIRINPNEENDDNKYKDRTTNKERSYSFVRDEQKQKINTQFVITQKTDCTDFDGLDYYSQETLKLCDRIIENIDKKNSCLSGSPEVDPTGLAQSVWQDIYVTTHRNPESCLYNVVELFIFKFLSDLGILKGDFSFDSVMKKIKDEGSSYGLKHYVKIVRPEIRELFKPSSEDGTGIINGTIFVNEYDEPVIENADLFASSLKKYEQFGNVKNVQKSFKSKLYEIFLKKDAGVKGLGQFFTPRKVIRQMVEMAQVQFLHVGARVCDPFCGVGGFLLETINNNTLRKDFELGPKGVVPKRFYVGYDKGNTEKDSQRTIILAKANMLIYLSDIIAKNWNKTDEYSKVFNNTFKLLKENNLGTLGIVNNLDDNKFDLILTNPPYIKKGSRAIKQIIETRDEYKRFYKTNGGGVEGLAIEWIVNNLKVGGRAFIVVPDGILNRVNDKKLRDFILSECYINGIISLPKKTFFATPKKTYILIITKKEKDSIQEFPIFSYLVSSIGESLDNHRLEIDDNDLEKAKRLFLFYYKREKEFSTEDSRCKLWSLKDLSESTHWEIDRRRSIEEKKALGIEEEIETGSLADYITNLDLLSKELEETKDQIEKISSEIENFETLDMEIGGENGLFDIQSGFTFKKNLYTGNPSDIPIIRIGNLSEKTSGIVYYPKSIEILPRFIVKKGDYLLPLTGSYFKMVEWDQEGIYYLNQRIARFTLREKFKNLISQSYLKEIISSIEDRVNRMGFSGNNNLRLEGEDGIEQIIIPIPVNEKGEFDKNMQELVAKKMYTVDSLRKKLRELFDRINAFKIDTEY